MISDLTRLADRRRTIALMVRQDLKTLYRRYRLGFVWTLGEPFLMAMLMWAVFTFIFAGGRGIGLQPFIVFLITGIYPFTWLSQTIRKSPRAYIRFGDVLQTSPLTPGIWPVRIVLVGMFEFITSIPIILIFIFVGGASLTWGTALFPVAMVLQLLLCTGFALFQAGLALRWPDVEVFASVLTRAFFWGSPILWSQKNFPEWMVPYLYLNPFHGVLDFYRASVWPEVLQSWQNYAISFGVILVILALGIWMVYGKGVDVRRIE
ncbi:MAG: ABC transporter permease [Micrococcales bacterium]|nr:ABC transporter permease [Micrococcales bacterium]